MEGTIQHRSSVLIIILHYGCPDDTRECIASLLRIKNQGYTILVVDNGTGSDACKKLQAEFPSIQTTILPENVGFAAANNIGLRMALENKFEFSLLLNNDTTVEPRFLEVLRGAMEDSKVAMAGPLFYFHSFPDNVWACGGRLYRWRVRIGAIHDLASINDDIADVDYLPGACILVRNSCLAVIGLMPESYFLGYEEAQFCLAAKRRGYRIVACRKSVVWHKVGMSSDPQPKYRYNTLRSRFLFASFLFGRALGAAFSCRVAISWLMKRPKDWPVVLAAVRDHIRFTQVCPEHLLDFDAEYACRHR